MARAYFSCSDCGESVETWGRNRREADRKAGWHESQGHLCGECQKKQRQADNEAAAQQNKTAGLPELAGSEKQVAWAETIRRETLDFIGTVLDGTAEEFQIQARWEEFSYSRGATGIKTDDPRLPAAVDALKTKTSASWWIDNRDTKLGVLLEEIAAEVEKEQRESAPEAIEAKDEATLRPEQELTSTVADIRALETGVIEIRFPEKREDFREIVKQQLGYKWSGNSWARKITYHSGPLSDRVAEAGNRLLAAGFIVRISDAAQRAAAIAGDYQPERKLWIKVRIAGKYEGWLALSWPRSADLYDDARALPGSRYDSPHVVVPAAQYEALADFAEIHGFSISDKAGEAMSRARAQHESALVVRPGAAPEENRTEGSTMPPATGEIDDALRDD